MAGMEVVRRAGRSRYWREGEARVVVEAWRASGETLAAFCREHGVAAKRVSRWAARLKQGLAVRFHPVQLRGSADPTSRKEFAVELPDGTTIRVPAGFDVGDLRGILAALVPGPGC